MVLDMPFALFVKNSDRFQALILRTLAILVPSLMASSAFSPWSVFLMLSALPVYVTLSSSLFLVSMSALTSTVCFDLTSGQ